MPVVMAPAKTAPDFNNRRRSNKPLPATCCIDKSFERLERAMRSSRCLAAHLNPVISLPHYARRTLRIDGAGTNKSGGNDAGLSLSMDLATFIGRAAR